MIRKLTEDDFELFVRTFFQTYLKFPFAPFHYEMFKHITSGKKRSTVLAFRESAKSTIVSLMYILWCICHKKKKFIILSSDTYTQAQLHLSNIIYELEHNELLLSIFGDLRSEKWTESNFITANGVRVISRGTGQKIRGFRHLESRPDLFVGDDLETSKTVLTRQQRDKTEKWILSEVIPAMDQENGQIIVVGNMLHHDSLMSRLRLNEQWEVFEVAIQDRGKPAWPERHSP